MKRWLVVALVGIACLWLGYTAVLLGSWAPGFLPSAFSALRPPQSMAEFGDALGAVGSLISAVALILGLGAVIIQARQNSDSNKISALTTRQQFLLAECARLEEDIQRMKRRANFEHALFDGMVQKKSRYLNEAREIDAKIRALIEEL